MNGIPGLHANRLLALLDSETSDRLEPAFEVKPLHARQILMHPDAPLSRGYFPLDGALSLIAFDASGAGVEVGSVGTRDCSDAHHPRDGDDADPGASSSCPGTAASLPAEVMLLSTSVANRSTRSVDRYVAALLFQTSQSVACNRLHDLQQRTARWLLTMDDRYRSDACRSPTTSWR